MTHQSHSEAENLIPDLHESSDSYSIHTSNFDCDDYEDDGFSDSDESDLENRVEHKSQHNIIDEKMEIEFPAINLQIRQISVEMPQTEEEKKEVWKKLNGKPRLKVKMMI